MILPLVQEFVQRFHQVKQTGRNLSILSNHISLNTPLKTLLDLDNAVLSFTPPIQNAAQNSSSLLPTTPYSAQVLPTHISQLLIKKRWAQCKWRKPNLLSDKANYNKLANSLKNSLCKHNSEKYLTYLISLTNFDNSLWRTKTNILCKKSKIPPLRNFDNSLAISNFDKANLFAANL